MAQYAVEFLPTNLSVAAGKSSDAQEFIAGRLNAWRARGGSWTKWRRSP